MRDRYQIIVCYHIDAECRTPLRSGGCDGETETILRRADGCAFIQAASLAGAFSDWLSDFVKEDRYKQFPDNITQNLFGDKNREGTLVFSDLVFGPEADELLRPRLRIDNKTGAAAEKAKFDVAHLASGSKGTSKLIWFGDSVENKELTAVEMMLSAVNKGEILLGAQKSNGYGKLAVTVRKSVYNMKDPEDRRAWVNAVPTGDVLALPSVPRRPQVRFRITGKLPNVLIKASAPENVIGDDGQEKMVFRNIIENDAAIIPGSSVKGAVRAQAERIARVSPLFSDDPEICEKVFGRGARGDDNGIAGIVHFSDVKLNPGNNAEVVTRIRINKFTGGVMRGALFSEGPISSAVSMSVVMPNSPKACALVLFALRDLGLGLYGFGSGASIGRGLLAEAEIRAEVPGDRELTLKFDRGRKAELTDTTGLWKEWTGTLEGGKA